MPEDAREAALQRLLEAHLAHVRGPLIAWYYTPMMLSFSKDIDPDLTVFDAMDELSKFKFAPVKLLELEQELIDRADIVFTGGSSLFEAKKDRHDNVHCFPSSVDRAHFMKARVRGVRAGRPGRFAAAAPRLLRRDRRALRYGLARRSRADAPGLDVRDGRPGREDLEDELPKRPNIHYLGGKTYAQLPAYLSGWDVALMPFAMNESTEFISPTKTPEYLAGGKPVVSTPIKDVVRHYGQLEGVKIADNAAGFRRAVREGAGAVA